tara:strand:+ start:59355 stop:59606 length:252 start_codon:yes stop_codon:yes gene_type:complete
LAEPAAPLLNAAQRGASQRYSRSDGNAGVPANLLRNRPDVLALERRFVAAVAGVSELKGEGLRMIAPLTMGRADQSRTSRRRY